jgi:hypothetical protein
LDTQEIVDIITQENGLRIKNQEGCACQGSPLVKALPRNGPGTAQLGVVKERLARYRQFKISVVGRKSGKTISTICRFTLSASSGLGV